MQDNLGRALAVWSNGSIQSSIQTSAGVWGPVVPVSFASDLGIAPDVAFAPNGSAMAIWIRNTAGVQDLQIATLPIGATVWSVPITIAVPTGNAIYSPQIKIDGKGRAVAVWGLYIPASATADTQFTELQSASYSAATGWSAPVTVSIANVSHYPVAPQLAINTAGTAVVVWNDSITPNGSRSHSLQVARRGAAGAWSKPRSLGFSGGGGVRGQKIAFDDFGHGTVVWQAATELNSAAVFAAQSSSTGVWALPERISAPSPLLIPEDAEVATDKAGNVTVVWSYEITDINGGYNGPGVSTRSRPVGSTSWSAPRKFSGGGYSPTISASPDGSLVAVGWNDSYSAYVSTYTPALGWAAGWKPVRKLASPFLNHYAYENTVSAGNGGVAAMAWTVTDFNRHPNTILNAATFK
ncbi:MAG: hypothetical protein ABL933_06470 [Methyloglobulus sp.]|nr:hypothetical protein [Methyloglobulus sp.]